MKTKREVEDQVLYIQKLLDMDANYDYDYFYEDIQDMEARIDTLKWVLEDGE
jgi:Tfp pilus assembly protein FimV